MKIILTKEQHKKTDHHHGWKLVESTTEEISNSTYHKITDAETIEFFRVIGGQERVHWDNATGKINRIESIAPDGLEKSEWLFEFQEEKGHKG